MIKKLTYFIIPFIFISFFQNVKAYNSETDYKFNISNFDLYAKKSNIDPYFVGEDYENFESDLILTKTNYLYDKFKNGDFKQYGKYSILLMYQGAQPKMFLFNSLDDLYLEKNSSISLKCNNCRLATGYTSNGQFLEVTSVKNNYVIMYFNKDNDSSNYYHYMYNYMIPEYNRKYLVYFSDNEILNKIFVNGYVSKPEINYSLEPIYKDGYLSSYGIKVNSSVVDDSKYKYQYAIKDNIDDEFNWFDLYNNNFLNNQFTYITKKPIYFYFRVLNKSNNEIIDSFIITVSFDLISPQYNIIFNQEKFYINGTNFINKVGLSIIYKTSIDGLKYQYQYVNDGSSLSDSNWLDTEGNVYKVYDTNGTLYARILDENNKILYSSTFSNKLIGTQDFLENPSNFPLYNKVQSVINFNKGSISDIVLIPVKILMFTSDSLNNNSCNEYSFGSLFGHELKLPCIDIKSYVGNTIYNFYDLVCSFFISLGIVKLLKNIYIRFMTLDIRDIDNKGGIF